MIAIAIACLLFATAVLALLSAADSLLRGWSAYGALAAELRTVRAGNAGANGLPAARSSATAPRPAHRPARHPARVPARIRIAA